MTGLAAGIPQLAIHAGSDQEVIADRVAEAGAARSLVNAEADAAAVHRAVTRLLGDPAHRAAAPWRYGITELDADRRLVGLAEKPGEPRSNIAVTGLYMYDNDVVRMAQDLVPSERGELEITDINRIYLEKGRAHLAELGRGFVWLDMGTHDSLLEAGQYVQILEQRQGVRIGCVEEVAYRKGFIDAEECRLLAHEQAGEYGGHLLDLVGADRVPSRRNHAEPFATPTGAGPR